MKIKILELDKPNKNRRIYSKETIEVAINKLENRTIYGCSEMNDKGFIDVAKISHRISDLQIENNFLIGELKPIEGYDFLFDFPDNFRPNGVGELCDNGEVKNYSIISIDFTTNPA